MSRGLSELDGPRRAALADLPPSAKLVTLVLLRDGQMTQQGIAEATLLSTRTARHALSELTAAGVVDSRVSFVDARQQVYSLAGEAAEGATPERPVPTVD